MRVPFPDKLAFLFKPMRYKVAYGGRGCIHADTLIDTPNGKIKVSDFTGGTVYTFDQVKKKIVEAQAEPPVQFDPEMLYRYTFTDGRYIIATKKHKFLTENGWLSGHEAYSTRAVVSSSSRPLTNEGIDLSIHALSEPHSFQREVSFLCYCLKGLYQYDAPLHFLSNTFQDFVPSLTYGQQRNRHVSLSEDVRLSFYKGVLPYRLSRLLSILPVLLESEGINCVGKGNYFVSKISGLSSQIYSIRPQFQKKCIRLLSFLESSCPLFLSAYECLFGLIRNLLMLPYRLFCTVLCASSSSPYLNNCNLFHHNNKIINIKQHGIDNFYDFTVPIYHNYLANGIVHHNSGKSWQFARAILILAASKKIRVLCVREVQKSIRDSVHRLLSDQIELLNLGSKYNILEAEIRCDNGSIISFTGLSSQTVESIKSYENYSICWVEEGQTISDRSWTILVPTIRAEGSEIWVSYNPELETDPTHQRFVINKRDDAKVVKLNYSDNPWFNDVLEQERLYCERTDPEGYKNIWEGECKPAVTGAIYYNEVQAAQNHRRVCNVPYDPMLKVHLVMDLGWGDSLGIGFVQKNLSEIRVINYLEYHQTQLDVMSSEIRDNYRYNWGKVWLPHDGFAKTLNADGQSTENILTKLGWDVVNKDDVSIISVEDGIRTARMKFSQCYFDKTNVFGDHKPVTPSGQTHLTHRLGESLKRYRRKVNNDLVATTPVHDDFSHGADCFRYIAINADNMRNEEEKKRQFVPNYGYKPLDAAIGY